MVQWQAALLVALDPLNSRYPMKAPTPTASMIQPLYVMNSNLHPSACSFGPKSGVCPDTHMMKNE